MNEAQRQAYLKHCGISFWYSRATLPGAARSRDFDFTGAAAIPRESVSEPSPTMARSAPRAQSREYGPRPRLIPEADRTTLDRVVAEAAASTKAIEKPTKPEPVSAIAKAPRTLPEDHSALAVTMSLRVATTDKLVLIAQVGVDLPEDVQDKLLLQIGIAMGHAITIDSLLSLSWPVFANKSVPGTDSEGLLQALSRILEPVRGRPWLCLGADISDLLKVFDGPGSEARIRFEHGLGGLATSGTLKRQLWDSIRSSSLLNAKTES